MITLKELNKLGLINGALKNEFKDEYFVTKEGMVFGVSSDGFRHCVASVTLPFKTDSCLKIFGRNTYDQSKRKRGDFLEMTMVDNNICAVFKSLEGSAIDDIFKIAEIINEVNFPDMETLGASFNDLLKYPTSTFTMDNNEIMKILLGEMGSLNLGFAPLNVCRKNLHNIKITKDSNTVKVIGTTFDVMDSKGEVVDGVCMAMVINELQIKKEPIIKIGSIYKVLSLYSE